MAHGVVRLERILNRVNDREKIANVLQVLLHIGAIENLNFADAVNRRLTSAYYTENHQFQFDLKTGELKAVVDLHNKTRATSTGVRKSVAKVRR